MQDLVKAVCPDMPADRQVAPTGSKEAWWKTVMATRTLMVPPKNVLRTSPILLATFVEAVTAFGKAHLDSPLYNWTDLNLHSFKGDECAAAITEMSTKVAPGSLVSVDIESRRVEWEDNRLLAIGFAINHNTSYAFYEVPLGGATSARVALQAFLNRIDVQFVWHNGKFDCTRLKWLSDLSARIDDDTMLQHYTMVYEKQGTHGLKYLGQLYLQAPAWEDELDEYKRKWCRDNKKKLADFMYDDIPTEVLIPYLHRDVIATWRLKILFEDIGRPESRFIYRTLCEASNVFSQIELAGLRVDLAYMEELEWELEKELREAEKHLDEVTARYWDPLKYAADTGAKIKLDEPFNIASPKQLKWMLETVLGHPVENTNAVTMDGLMVAVENGLIKESGAKEFLEAVGTTRKLSKYLETYVLGIRDIVCRDERIRTTFNLHGTETGRLSSSKPNLQNIPRNKKIKNLYVAQPGYKLLQLDYSQAELRVLAMLSEDDYLIQIYKDGKDLHDAVAEAMFGEGFDKEQRNMAKTINFGIAYGRGPSSIAEKFGKSMNESREIIARWFAPMPKVEAFIKNRRKMPQSGARCTTVFGRERHFIVTNENLNHVQNEYINTPIQSIASDLTLLSLLRIHKWLHHEKLTDVARIVLTVHDSIILEVKDDPELLERVGSTGAEIMAQVPLDHIPDCKVPFKADVETGYKWGEMSK